MPLGEKSVVTLDEAVSASDPVALRVLDCDCSTDCDGLPEGL